MSPQHPTGIFPAIKLSSIQKESCAFRETLKWTAGTTAPGLGQVGASHAPVG